jgi:hypothetical protein
MKHVHKAHARKVSSGLRLEGARAIKAVRLALLLEREAKRKGNDSDTSASTALCFSNMFAHEAPELRSSAAHKELESLGADPVIIGQKSGDAEERGGVQPTASGVAKTVGVLAGFVVA